MDVRMTVPGTRLLAALSLSVLLVGTTWAGDAPTNEAFEAEIAELEGLLEGRDTDIYELDFRPGRLDRVLIQNRLGEEEVFHYVTFRLRNRVSKDAETLVEHASAFQEVLDAITREYASTRAVTEGGARLEVTGIESSEHQELATILEREDLRVKARTVTLTALVTDEHGTRFRLLDPVPGEGPQERFAFDDRGVVVHPANHYQQVHDAIEEQEGRRLFTLDDLRGQALPPYDPGQPSSFADGYGMAQGEVHGVLVFDRFNPEANRFDVRVFGLSNKIRMRWPEELPADRVEDYWNLVVLRRVYVMSFTRSGDEFFRELDGFALGDHDWAWEPSFQRIANRRDIAYARYYLNNIRLDTPRSRRGTVDTGAVVDGRRVTEDIDLPVLHDGTVANAVWQEYKALRDEVGASYQARIERVEAQRSAVNQLYQVTEGEAVTAPERERRQAERGAWQQLLVEAQAYLKDRRDRLVASLKDWQAVSGGGE